MEKTSELVLLVKPVLNHQPGRPERTWGPPGTTRCNIFAYMLYRVRLNHSNHEV